MRNDYSRKVFALADGRSIELAMLHAENWKMVGGIITQKRCSKCNEFLPVEQFSRKHNSLFPWCKPCFREYNTHYALIRARKNGRKAKDYLEYHKGGPSGDDIQCPSCKRWLPFRGARLCYFCRDAKVTAARVRGRIRETFGEDSEEYRLAQNEKRYHHLKALCTLLGIPAYRGVLYAKKRGKIRGVLPFMSLDNEGREKALEREIEKKTAAFQKGRTRNSYVEMWRLPQIQV